MRKTSITFLLILFICSALALSLRIPIASSGERFTEQGDGTVIDHELGLMWAKSDNRLDTDWQEADWYCKMGPPDIVGKYSDWRMPTRDELKSIYVLNPQYRGYRTACGARVRVAPQIRLSCGQIWCDEREITSAWVYSFIDGSEYTAKKSIKAGYRALPVRSLKAGEF